MIGRAIGSGVGRLRDGAARGLLRLGLRPNQITVFGCLVTVAAGALVVLGRLRLGGVVLIAASACDVLDGAVARVGNRKTAFGAFLDSTLDRIGDLAVFGGLGVYFAALGNLTYTLLSILSLGAAEVVSYTRARAECLVPSCKVGFWERGERSVLIIVALVAGRPLLALWVLATLPWLTVLHRMVHTRAAMRADGGGSSRCWAGACRLFFFAPRRGSWPYDLVAGAILAGAILLPLRLSDPLRILLNSLPVG